MTKTKVAVIGLDGCSPRYLEKIISHGFVPTIRSIVEKHGYYKLYAFPPCTPPSWSSIMTGVNPGKHGIFGFQHYDRRGKRVYLTNTMHLEHPRVHEMLGMNGIPSIMINPIPSYPIIPVKNTIQISHMFFTPRLSWFPEQIGRYAKILREHEYKSKTREEFLDNVSNSLDKYLDLVESIVDKIDWRLFWINLHYPDAILHKFDEEWVFSKSYYMENKIFGKIDHIIKILVDRSDYTLIVSDHGFAHYHTIINVNSYLFVKGFVNKTLGNKGLKEFWEHSNKEEYFVIRNNILLKLANLKVISNISIRLRRIIEDLTGKKIKVAEYNADINRSKAFLLSTYSHGIILNDLRVKNNVIKELSRLEGIKNVIESAKIFHGNYLDRAPDLLVIPDYDNGYILGKNKISRYVLRKRKTNNHHPIGILVISGVNVLSNNVDPVLPNHVVANIVLALLDQPLSTKADDVELARKITGKTGRTRNYVDGWKLSKRLVSLRLA